MASHLAFSESASNAAAGILNTEVPLLSETVAPMVMLSSLSEVGETEVVAMAMAVMDVAWAARGEEIEAGGGSGGDDGEGGLDGGETYTREDSQRERCKGKRACRAGGTGSCLRHALH